MSGFLVLPSARDRPFSAVKLVKDLMKKELNKCGKRECKTHTQCGKAEIKWKQQTLHTYSALDYRNEFL